MKDDEVGILYGSHGPQASREGRHCRALRLLGRGLLARGKGQRTVRRSGPEVWPAGLESRGGGCGTDKENCSRFREGKGRAGTWLVGDLDTLQK